MSNQEKKIQEFLEEYYENSNEGLWRILQDYCDEMRSIVELGIAYTKKDGSPVIDVTSGDGECVLYIDYCPYCGKKIEVGKNRRNNV